MKIYVFGNIDHSLDSQASYVAQSLTSVFPKISFITVAPNEDLPFIGESKVTILDTVTGIEKVELFDDKMLDNLILSPRGSVHDFDLAFQLKYLKKLGKLGNVNIIALPQGKKPDYLRIKSILRKLVAQDMHGS